MNKKCLLCDDEFLPKNPNARYCDKQHYKNCKTCGNSFEIKNNYKIKDFCSRKCTTAKPEKPQKVCKRCGKKFSPTKSQQVYCDSDHYSKCEYCAQDILLKNPKRVNRFCSVSCSSKFFQRIKNVDLVCEFCGDSFSGTRKTERFCKKDHYAKCEGCGENFIIKSLRRPARTCSKKCAMAIVDCGKRLEKSIATSRGRYGVDNVSQSSKIKEKKEETTFKNYGVKNIFQLPENQIKGAFNNGKRISKVNVVWQEKILDEFGVEFEFEKKFGDSCYADLGYKNVLIDINPSFTHNASISFPHLTGRCKKENCSKTSHLPKSTKYHQERALEAEKEGFILLQYFDWYDEGIFLDIVRAKLLLDEHKIPAKRTVLKEIEQVEANRFFDENHLMGRANKQTVCVGLFYKGELIHCQTYGPARFNKNFEWEAIRSCSKRNYHVQGGFSKCDKYFFKKYNPISVVSYVDMSISSGRTESTNKNWKMLSINSPSAVWVNVGEDSSRYPLFVSDNTARRVSADRLLGFEVGEKYSRFDVDGNKITNDFVLLSEGFVKVFGAGTKTFGFRK